MKSQIKNLMKESINNTNMSDLEKKILFYGLGSIFSLGHPLEDSICETVEKSEERTKNDKLNIFYYNNQSWIRK